MLSVTNNIEIVIALSKIWRRAAFIGFFALLFITSTLFGRAGFNLLQPAFSGHMNGSGKYGITMPDALRAFYQKLHTGNDGTRGSGSLVITEPGNEFMNLNRHKNETGRQNRQYFEKVKAIPPNRKENQIEMNSTSEG